MIENDISEEVFQRVQHRANIKGSIRNRVFSSDPQNKLLEYLTELELRIEKLERRIKDDN